MNTLLLELMEKRDVLSVEMNYRECGFGKFLYGSEIRELEALDTQLASYFEAIKEPHKLLHDSARDIQNILSSEPRTGMSVRLPIFGRIPFPGWKRSKCLSRI